MQPTAWCGWYPVALAIRRRFALSCSDITDRLRSLGVSVDGWQGVCCVTHYKVMRSIVITRQQAATNAELKIAVEDLDGEVVVVTLRLPDKVKDGTTIGPKREDLAVKKRYRDHKWPKEVKVRVRIPDWRIRNAVAGLPVLAGMLAGAWLYTLVFLGVWAGIAFSARHSRLHAVDQFEDPGFWLRFRNTLASTAWLYFVPIGAIIAFYLVIAAVLSFADGTMTVHQLETTQRVFSTVSEFVDTWIKLKEGPMLVALIGVWLLSCLLLAYKRDKAVNAGGSTGRLRRMRLDLARGLNRTAGAYARYSGPAAAAVSTLASFTFLTTVPGNLGTKPHLQAVASTDNYKYAAKKVEALLSAQVVSSLYAQIRKEMPPDYQQALAHPLSAQVAQTRQQADLLVAPLKDSDRGAAARLETEESRFRDTQNLPPQSVVKAERGNDPIDTPRDLTAGQAAAAKQAAESDPSDNRVEVVNDSGKEVLLQVEKVASEGGWAQLKNLVSSRFPLAGPMVDALAEACDEQLQETLREKVPALVKPLADKGSDIKTAIARTAKDIVAAVNVSDLVKRHATEASQLAADQQARLKDMKTLEDQLKIRVNIVKTLQDGATSQEEFDSAVERVRDLSDLSLQMGVVDDLRVTIMPDSGVGPSAKQGAAVAIHDLYHFGLPMVTIEDAKRALPLCGCPGL